RPSLRGNAPRGIEEDPDEFEGALGWADANAASNCGGVEAPLLRVVFSRRDGREGALEGASRRIAKRDDHIDAPARVRELEPHANLLGIWRQQGAGWLVDLVFAHPFGHRVQGLG